MPWFRREGFGDADDAEDAETGPGLGAEYQKVVLWRGSEVKGSSTSASRAEVN